MDTLSLNDLGSIFAEALVEVISKTSSFSLRASMAEQDADFYGITGVMSLNSKKSGMIFISVEEADMKAVCSYMIGVKEDELTREDILDALCELVNMTAGNAKARIYDADYMFALSSPFIITGSGMSIISKKRSTVISKTLSGDGDISIKLKVVY